MEPLTASPFWQNLGLWTGAVCTLAMFSFLWRENKVYRFFEHVFVGLAVGYAIGVTWTDVLKPNWWDKAGMGLWFHPAPAGTESQRWWGLLGVAGLLWYCQLSSKTYWLSRIVMGALMGSGAGLIFRKIDSFFFGQSGQLTQSFKPLVLRSETGHLIPAWDNILIGITLVCVLYYFIFWNRSRSRAGEVPSRMGRWLLMVSFGAVFGSTVMARLSLLIERAHYLLVQCLGLGG